MTIFLDYKGQAPWDSKYRPIIPAQTTEVESQYVTTCLGYMGR